MFSIYYTLFVPGSGGNHVSNILSLGLGNTALNDFYKNNSTMYFHSTEYLFHTQQQVRESMIRLKSAKLPVSLCGHFAELVTLYDELSKFGKIKIIVCDLPTDNSFCWARIRAVNYWIHDSLVYSEQRLLYSSSIIKKLFNLTDDDVVDLSIEQIYQKDISNTINYLNYMTGLSIPVEQGQQLHDIWLNKNYYNLV